MPLEKDLSAAPHFDDFNEDKKFHRVLFKPDEAVQVRELNTLQTILQNQIERFGNNILTRGTIIDGANFIFYDTYPYAKINDLQLEGSVAAPENYVGYLAKNETGLIARIIDYAEGFEATVPDLKTVYLRYLNSGQSYEETTFDSGQILTVYDANNVISKINISTPGSGYSNSDSVVITSVFLANVNSGQFLIGDTITNPTTGAHGVIVSITENTNTAPNMILGGSVTVNATTSNVVGTSTAFLSNFSNGDFITVFSNTTSYTSKKINVVSNNTFMNLASNTGVTLVGAQYANTVDKTVFVKYRPRNVDLASDVASANLWTFSIGDSIYGSSNTNLAQVNEIYGYNAEASLLTDSSGRIIETTITNAGIDYTIVPQASVKTSAGTAATLIPQNFLTQITVSSLSGSIGTGYAFGVTEGIIYQKGFFIKVDPQTIIVSKYTNVPDRVTVGFQTDEEIIDANIDSSLFDNVVGDNNLAPGADRLKLEAILTVKDLTLVTDDAEFFNLVEWSEGFPYKQQNRTVYNVIGDEMDIRTREISGDSVIDPFLVNTTDPTNANNIANTFNVVVDPGIAYINGGRVETVTNYIIKNDKATESTVDDDNRVSVDYGNYIRVNNLGGYFEFDRANVIDLYDTPKAYLGTPALVTAGNLAPIGTKIGTARLRNFVFEQGTPGTPSAIYRMYVFDITMNVGKNFSNVRSIAYDGAVDGIADTVLEPNSSGTANVATVYSMNNSLLFRGSYTSPLNANNISYQYRTIDAQQISNTGIITISLSATPTKNFPYSGVLSDAQKTDIYVTPSSNLVAFTAISGTVSVSSTNNAMIGVGTNFVSEVKPGQYLSVNNSIVRVVSVTNTTHTVLESNSAVTSAAVAAYPAWLATVPVALQFNSGYSANVSGSNNEVLSINLGSTMNFSGTANVSVAYNVEQKGTATPKTVNRNRFVKLQLSNNAATSTGPWSLGVPDIFRLRNVYKGTSTVNTNSSNVTSEFFVDHNQNLNYYNLGTLNKIEKSSLVLTADDFLLIEFDAFTASPGFYNINSYVSGNKSNRFIEDNKILSDLTTTVNTFEIPEVFSDTGSYYDLINCVDFRPYAANTAALSTTIAGATINPSNTVTFADVDRFFPVPGSIFTSDIEYFEHRVDAIVLDVDKNIRIVKGNKGSFASPTIPAQTMRLNNISIPVYPSLPNMLLDKTKTLAATGVMNKQFANRRISQRAIRATFTDLEFSLSQPKNYTSRELGSMERRIKNLEYYQLLTLSQSAVKDKVIPSSLASNVDRFKYGFFIDNFDDTNYSEVNSPEYRALVEDGYVGPSTIAFNTVHTGIGITSAPYDEVNILTQPLATLDPIPPPPPIVKYVGTMIITPPTFKTQQIIPIAVTTTPAKSSKKGKIVCTAMNDAYGFGSFRSTIWLAHSAKHLKKEHEVGYHAIFLPLVDFAYKSDKKDTVAGNTVRTILERIARKRTADIWKQKKGKMDLEGRIYRSVLEPLCFFVGKILGDKNGK